jgi:predicted small lipoprotein YifL
MKKYFSFFPVLMLCSICACNNSGNASTPPADVAKDSANFTQVQWLDSSINFGSVTKGEKVHITYKCKNVGNKPMFIYYVRPGCGCTVADYTKAAIPPGGTGEVNAEYDSNHGIAGEVRKSITVQTNTTNPSPRLIFFGTVKPAPGTDSTKKS